MEKNIDIRKSEFVIDSIPLEWKKSTENCKKGTENCKKGTENCKKGNVYLVK